MQRLTHVRSRVQRRAEVVSVCVFLTFCFPLRLRFFLAGPRQNCQRNLGFSLRIKRTFGEDSEMFAISSFSRRMRGLIVVILMTSTLVLGQRKKNPSQTN